MDCHAFKKDVGRVPVERLPEPALDHARSCADCGKELAELEEIRRLLPQSARDVRPDFHARLERAVQERKVDLPRSPRYWPGVAASLAAGLLLGFFAYLMVLAPGKSLPPDEVRSLVSEHLGAAEAFFRQARNLRGEDPQKDLEILSAEWRLCGLGSSAEELDPHRAAICREFGRAGDAFVGSIRRMRSAVSAGLARGTAEGLEGIRSSIGRESVLQKIERLRKLVAPPPTDGPVPLPDPSKLTEIEHFLFARAMYYRGHHRGAAVMFETFCEQYPDSPYRSDALYWQARCATDAAAFLGSAARITEEEWIDDRLAQEFAEALGDPRVAILRDPEGNIRIGYFEEDGTVTVYTLHGKLTLRAPERRQ